MPLAVIVGASTGIGLAITRRLIAAGWDVTGLSRTEPAFTDARYRHVVADVRSVGYRQQLRDALGDRAPDACLYVAGIGRALDLVDPSAESDVFATNLLGAVATIEVVLPRMIAARAGHVIGLSSQADRLIDDHAPSYAASKAGLSSYLEGLAFACRPHGVAITNVRFGFVDTAMSAGQGARPLLMTADRAAEHVMRCLKKRPIRYTRPRRIAAILWLVTWGRRIRIWFS